MLPEDPVGDNSNYSLIYAAARADTVRKEKSGMPSFACDVCFTAQACMTSLLLR